MVATSYVGYRIPHTQISEKDPPGAIFFRRAGRAGRARRCGREDRWRTCNNSILLVPLDIGHWTLDRPPGDKIMPSQRIHTNKTLLFHIDRIISTKILWFDPSSFRDSVMSTVMVSLMWKSCLLISVVLVSCRSSSHVLAEESSSAANDFGIFAWIDNAATGYVNPFQEYRQLDDGTYGMFATGPIAEGDLLADIPWSHVFKASDDEDEDDAEAIPEGYLECALVKALTQEWKDAEASKFAPFLKFLRHASQRPPMNHLPSAWSPQGQRVIRKIVGGVDPSETRIPPIEPTEWLAVDWYTYCEGSPEGAPAALLAIQWAEERTLVPMVAGMYNHRNGAWTGARVTSIEAHRPVQIYATRDIAAGEQIYITQNLCDSCERRIEIGYGTPGTSSTQTRLAEILQSESSSNYRNLTHFLCLELFRDYGFIEEMPQRWHYLVDITFVLDEDPKTGLLQFQWESDRNITDPSKYWQETLYLRRELRRLNKLRNFEFQNGNPGIPQHEWETAWKFLQAHVVALEILLGSYSLPSATNETVEALTQEWNRSELFSRETSHYQSLEWTYDDINYNEPVCDNTDTLRFLEHEVAEIVKSPYQELTFSINPETEDVVLDLDNILQIASNYRPQYHEYMVHAATRYLDTVKRVVFVGGGDSMLLHELLKYPDIELVVGLELDQYVVRKSFKYFYTQPHFDDPRVEWWFGDATKSLLLLSKDYWRSFDLVLVDLSETVMSLSVTNELDVFDALALLLKPEGILVKNEHYLDDVSEVFDYSIQLRYECPNICQQVMAMGSNKVDFLHAPLKDHGVPTLLYEPMVREDNRLDLMHDYRRNDARLQGKCDASSECSAPAEEQFKSAGIMEIVDAEKVAIPLDASLVKLLQDAIANEGFTLTTTPVLVGDMIFIVMKEGYIVVRTWPLRNYCSMDVNLWGRFDRLHLLRAALTAPLQSSLVSKFRVVVGGMFGSSTWNEDRLVIGPQKVQARQCEEKEFHDDVPEGVTLPSATELIVAYVEASFEHVVPSNEVTAVVICGLQGEDCLAMHLAESSDKVGKAIRLSLCPDTDSIPKMYECEIALKSQLESALEAKELVELILVDESAPMKMLQIVDSILSDDEFFQSTIAGVNTMLAWSTKPAEETWRRYFLEYYRRYYEDDPVSRGEITMQSGTTSVEVGMVACGFERAADSILRIEASLQEQFPPQKNILDVTLQTIYGGKFKWLEPYESKEFLQSDYDNKPGQDQFFGQKPSAHHVVYQLEPNGEEPGFEFSVDNLQDLFRKSLSRVSRVDFECSHQGLYQGLGEGCVLACLSVSMGSVVLTWDGRTHIDVSFYLIGSKDDTIFENFSNAFLFHAGSRLQVTLEDQMARGTGRAINPKSELLTRAELKAFYEELRQRSFDDEEDGTEYA